MDPPHQSALLEANIGPPMLLSCLLRDLRQAPVLQVFDSGSRNVLRQLKGHQQACHVARFAPGGQHILSAGDDTTVRWWDVAAGEQQFRLEGHTDYVRSAAVNPVSQDVWATGGYDHVCRLWDVRSQQVRPPVAQGISWTPACNVAAYAALRDPLNDVRRLPKMEAGVVISTAGRAAVQGMSCKCREF